MRVDLSALEPLLCSGDHVRGGARLVRDAARFGPLSPPAVSASEVVLGLSLWYRGALSPQTTISPVRARADVLGDAGKGPVPWFGGEVEK